MVWKGNRNSLTLILLSKESICPRPKTTSKSPYCFTINKISLGYRYFSKRTWSSLIYQLYFFSCVKINNFSKRESCSTNKSMIDKSMGLGCFVMDKKAMLLLMMLCLSGEITSSTPLFMAKKYGLHCWRKPGVNK